jgi:hypothetical protein
VEERAQVLCENWNLQQRTDHPRISSTALASQVGAERTCPDAATLGKHAKKKKTRSAGSLKLACLRTHGGTTIHCMSGEQALMLIMVGACSCCGGLAPKAQVP